jgi:type II secretory pathway pseudopilin PulG
MMTVVGILALLVGILLPALVHVYGRASKTRVAADFGAISTALEAYRQDFGDYPRANSGYPNTGFGTLGFALVGPGPAAGAPPTFDNSLTYDPGAVVSSGVATYICLRPSSGNAVTNNYYWALFFGWHDGADGPGFRTGTGTIDTNGDGIPDSGVPTGRTWGPYMSADHMKVNGAGLIDHTGNPILYFPANKKANPTLPNGFVGAVSQSMFNANDNFEQARRSGEPNGVVLDRIRLMFGDYNLNGQIDSGNSPTEVPPPQGYVLWSAGSDGVLGPTGPFVAGADASENQRQVQKCDDVTNIP